MPYGITGIGKRREWLGHENLSTAREAAGLSQGQVAKLSKCIDRQFRKSRRRVAGEELAEFATLYGVSVEWLTTASEESDAGEDRILLAARELSKMKDQDLDRLMTLLRMLRKP